MTGRQARWVETHLTSGPAPVRWVSTHPARADGANFSPRRTRQDCRPGHATPCHFGINGVTQTAVGQIAVGRHIHPAWRSTVQDQRHIGKLRPFAPVRKVSFREPVQSGQLLLPQMWVKTHLTATAVRWVSTHPTPTPGPGA